MKTITLDFDLYNEELADREECGRNIGINEVLDFLESKRTLRDFLMTRHLFREGTDLNLKLKEWDWVRIAEAIDRPIE